MRTVSWSGRTGAKHNSIRRQAGGGGGRDKRYNLFYFKIYFPGYKNVLTKAGISGTAKGQSYFFDGTGKVHPKYANKISKVVSSERISPIWIQKDQPDEYGFTPFTTFPSMPNDFSLWL